MNESKQQPSFELPSNIRQIGTIGDGMRIYVEDYVNTYLKQYAESGGHCEKLAFLVGKNMIIDGRPHLFISGAVQGKFGEFEDGVENFTDKSYSYAEEQIAQYFDDYEIVGWMQSQPGYGVSLNKAYREFHMNNFTKPWNVLFVMDPVERVSSFYVWNENNSEMTETRGYFIYYDKNPGMQEYMLENKIIKLSVKDKAACKALTSSPALKEPSAVLKKTKEETPEYKRVINMLVSLSAVLFVICFIMGAGIIQSDSRVAKLERNYNALDSAYSYLVAEESKPNTQSVFAETVSSEGDNIYEIDIDQPLEAAKAEATAIATATEFPSASPTEPPTTLPTELPTEAPSEQPTQLPPTVAPAANLSWNQTPETYTVQQGDTLNYISYKFYGTPDKVQDIMAINDMTDPDLIYFGKVIYLP